MTKEKLINIIKFVVIALIFLFIGDIAIYLLSVFGVNTSNLNSKHLALIDSVLELIIGVILIFLYKKELIKDKDKFQKEHKKVNTIFKYSCLFMGIKILSAVVVVALKTIFNIEINISENQDAINTITNSAPYIMLFSASVLAPITEELIFRLGIKKIISKKYPFIIISGTIFGLMHIFPTDLNIYIALIDGISYVAMGITLAYIYDKTDNIYFTIIIHALNNFLGMLAVIL